MRIAHDAGHSDVHLGVGEVPRYRPLGDMQGTDWPVTRAEVFQGWLQEILTPQQIDGFNRDKEFDGSHAFPFVRVRINLMDSLRGPAMVLRLIPQTILTMEQLNLPSVLESLAARPKGLILVTGPTGSGKSTTLAAMIDWINRNEARHILTIEDPVEFVHESRKSLIRHREVGLHTLKFHNALRAALREDPDVILVGEMRDRETAQIALQASLTGHLVMSTLHTSDVVETIARVVDLGAEPWIVANALQAVIAQRLVRVLCSSCKAPKTLDRDVDAAASGGRVGLAAGEVIYTARGCSECHDTGYVGRTGIFEVLQIDDHLRDLIKTRASTRDYRAHIESLGKRRLRELGLHKVAAGETTLEEVHRVT